MKNTLDYIINHVALVVDASGSIHERGLTETTIKVVDAQIAHMAQQSRDASQEFRVSIYFFADVAECVVYDRDVLRLPSIREIYEPHGQTALIDGTLQAIKELKLIPQLYANHAFLGFVITDGGENHSRNHQAALAFEFEHMEDNWTFGAMVPNLNSVAECKRFGFPADNVQMWSTSTRGMEEVGEVMRRTTDAFINHRKHGGRGTKNLFKMDATVLSKAVVSSNLLPLRAADYRMLPVHRDEKEIRSFVERFTKEDYRAGSAYYELVKSETIQPRKEIAILENSTGKVFVGDSARDILGLPSHEIRVTPETNRAFRVFIQSTSYNRKLPKGTQLLVMK